MATSVVFASQELLSALCRVAPEDIEFWDAANPDEAIALSTGAPAVVVEVGAYIWSSSRLAEQIRVLKPSTVIVVVSAGSGDIDAEEFIAADLLLAGPNLEIVAALIPQILRYGLAVGRAIFGD
jgi:hypothetical protein